MLGAFAKTELLGAGQSQVLRLKMPVKAMASYDDLGKIQASAYVLEAGNYSFRIGNSVRNTVKLDYEYQAAQTVVIEQLERKCAPAALKSRRLATGPTRNYRRAEDVYEKNRLIPQDIDTLEGVEPMYRESRIRRKKNGEMRTGSPLKM